MPHSEPLSVKLGHYRMFGMRLYKKRVRNATRYCWFRSGQKAKSLGFKLVLRWVKND